jgi:hypothetical protein
MRFLLRLLTAARDGHCEYRTDAVAVLTGHEPGAVEVFLRRPRPVRDPATVS